ncbi:MAG: hypothetical protein R3330_12285, partial [Saprospiraceae bacterium]|nr:hypothetical protein [Saprospiraceae bacterium]
ECSSQEMPFVLSKFPSYDAFGKASLDEIIPPEQREGAVHAAISTFSSVVLMNNGDLQFTIQELPEYCQTGPIKALAVADVNQDDILDIIYVGNHYPTEVETARFDALVHGVCLGSRGGTFKVRALPGLRGDYRQLAAWPEEEGLRLVLARNNRPLETCLLSEALQLVQ